MEVKKNVWCNVFGRGGVSGLGRFFVVLGLGGGVGVGSGWCFGLNNGIVEANAIANGFNPRHAFFDAL